MLWQEVKDLISATGQASLSGKAYLQGGRYNYMQMQFLTHWKQSSLLKLSTFSVLAWFWLEEDQRASGRGWQHWGSTWMQKSFCQSCSDNWIFRSNILNGTSSSPLTPPTSFLIYFFFGIGELCTCWPPFCTPFQAKFLTFPNLALRSLFALVHEREEAEALGAFWRNW